MRNLYSHSCVICAHGLICICGILTGKFVAGPYMAITYELDIVVGCVLVHLCQHVGSICPCSIMAVWVMFVMWQSDLFSDIKYVYSDIGVNFVPIHVYICMSIPAYRHISQTFQLRDIYNFRVKYLHNFQICMLPEFSILLEILKFDNSGNKYICCKYGK